MSPKEVYTKAAWHWKWPCTKTPPAVAHPDLFLSISKTWIGKCCSALRVVRHHSRPKVF